MTPQQIVGLGFRILAIYLGLFCLQYWVGIPERLASTHDISFYTYLVGAVYSLIALVLWFFPMVFAHRIIPRTKFENHLNLQALDAARVGCSLVGLWIFADAFPNLVWLIFGVTLQARAESFFSVLTWANKASIVIGIGQIAFAFILMCRSADFARFVLRPENDENKAQ